MKVPAYFDVHSHCNDVAFDEDRSSVLRELAERDIWTITVGTDRDMSLKAAEMTEDHKGVFAAIGVHPVDKPGEGFEASFYSGLVGQYPKVVAIGECGLDYFRLDGDAVAEKKRQKELFEVQMEFAIEHQLPLMLHVRGAKADANDAHKDLLDILENRKKTAGDALQANVHFFSGDLDIAKRYFDLDLSVSVTGVVTFTHDYDKIVQYAPLTHIMSETDAPYVAPVPYRGKRNSPLYISEIVAKIADIRQENVDSVKRAMVDNALRRFNILKKMA